MDGMMNPSAPGQLCVPASGLFDFRNTRSFTRHYMETFYRDKPATNDERAVLKFLVKHLAHQGRTAAVLEVGCGPTVHHILPLVPYASELHMADYLPENLEEVRRWVENAPDAYQWHQYTALVLEFERGEAPASAIEEREAQARAKVRRLLPCDLTTPHILIQPVTYDIVTAFYCTEEVGVDIAAWEGVMTNLCRTVAPGGMLYLSCLRNTDHYLVGDTRYPCARITEADLRRVLPALGFDMRHSVVEGKAVENQEDEGVFGVVLVAARKKP
jgi:hypothetical protein